MRSLAEIILHLLIRLGGLNWGGLMKFKFQIRLPELPRMETEVFVPTYGGPPSLLHFIKMPVSFGGGHLSGLTLIPKPYSLNPKQSLKPLSSKVETMGPEYLVCALDPGILISLLDTLYVPVRVPSMHLTSLRAALGAHTANSNKPTR